MGSYLYEQTSRTYKITIPDRCGSLVNLPDGAFHANLIQFYCKPDWDLWETLWPVTDPRDKRIVAAYRRKKAVAAKRVPNRLVVLGDQQSGYTLFQWREGVEPKILFCDDDTFGRHLIEVAKLVKIGGRWQLDLALPPLPMADLQESAPKFGL